MFSQEEELGDFKYGSEFHSLGCFEQSDAFWREELGREVRNVDSCELRKAVEEVSEAGEQTVATPSR